MPARSRILVAVCAATAATAALTGCGGHGSDDSSAPLLAPAATTAAKTQPFADLTASALLDKAVKDMRGSGAMALDISSGGSFDGTSLQATVTTSGRCTLTADVDGESVEVIGSGGTGGYLKGDSGFWIDVSDDDASGDAAAAKFAGKWVKLTQQEFTGLGMDHVCDLDEFLDDMTSEIGDGTLRKSAEIPLDDGQQVIPLVHTVSGRMTTIFVSTGSSPHVVKSETAAGAVTLFTDYGKQPHLSAPPHPLTIAPADLGSDLGGNFHV